MSETYEKVRVGDLKVGDVVQISGFVDDHPVEVTAIDMRGESVAFSTTRYSPNVWRRPFLWKASNLVFRVKKDPSEELRAALQKVVDDFAELVSASDGVAGLHHNGDVATWAELDMTGQFASWIGEAFAGAKAVLAKTGGNDDRS